MVEPCRLRLQQQEHHADLHGLPGPRLPRLFKNGFGFIFIFVIMEILTLIFIVYHNRNIDSICIYLYSYIIYTYRYIHTYYIYIYICGSGQRGRSCFPESRMRSRVGFGRCSSSFMDDMSRFSSSTLLPFFFLGSLMKTE